MTEQENQNGQGFLSKYILPFVRIYFMMQVFKYFTGSSNSTNLGNSAVKNYADVNLHPLWPKDTLMGMRVCLSEYEFYKNCNKFIYENSNLKYDSYDEDNYYHREVAIPDMFLNVLKENGTVYAHVVLYRHGAEEETGDDPSQLVTTKPLNKYLPQIKNTKKSLLGNKTEEEVAADDKYLSYVNLNLTVQWLADRVTLPSNLPPSVEKLITFTDRGYKPPVLLNEFWILRDDLVEVNSSTRFLKQFSK
jgi:hypothetical protein